MRKSFGKNRLDTPVHCRHLVIESVHGLQGEVSEARAAAQQLAQGPWVQCSAVQCSAVQCSAVWWPLHWTGGTAKNKV
jgi:hypothetical protein